MDDNIDRNKEIDVSENRESESKGNVINADQQPTTAAAAASDDDRNVFPNENLLERNEHIKVDGKIISEAETVVPEQLTGSCVTSLTSSTSEQDPDLPDLPPKTYQWEDIRRAKVQGGYPWTYLKYTSSDESVIDLKKMSSDKINEGASSSSSPVHNDDNTPPRPPSTTPSISDVLKTVDHSLPEHPRVLKHQDSVTSSATSTKSRQSSITHIIIPIDHTVIEDAHIYEPYDLGPDEGKEEYKKENEDIFEDVKIQQKPPLTKMLLENQSMSVDEERFYLDKKIFKLASLDEDYNKWSSSKDHEYEPISAPSGDSKTVGVDSQESKVPIVQLEELVENDDDAGSITSAERKFLRIPMDEELVVPEDGQSEDAAMSEGDINVDDRFFNATPTTIGSRTDGEHTSQVDSSALENLPLKRENRKHATLALEENTSTQNFGQRMKLSATKLKTKIKGMKRPGRGARGPSPAKEPKVPKVERIKSDGFIARARKMERPKFTMPKMPERPKINLPKMPDRPRLSLPKMPDIPRPKMPDMPKMPTISRPKMPDMPKMPTISRPKMPDMKFPKMDISFPGRGNKEPAGEEDESEPKKKKFDFRTYPRILNRKKKPVVQSSITTSSGEPEPGSKSTFFTSIPDWVTMPRKSLQKGPVGHRWANKFKDISYADAESVQSKEKLESFKPISAPIRTDDPLVQYIPLRDYSREEPEEEDPQIDSNNILFHDEVFDSDIPQPEKAKSVQSLPEAEVTDVLPASGRASSERGGVIEEINADEFFVREKGISQDNINVSLYLSSEIREAFQHPINALSQMLEINGGYYEYDKNQLDQDYSKMRDSPLPPPIIEDPPTKTLRKKKKPSFEQSIENISPSETPIEGPPSRPSRSRKSSILSSRGASIENINRGYPIRPSRSGKSSVVSSRGVSIENINRVEAEPMYRTPPPPKPVPSNQGYPVRPSRSGKSSVASSRGVSIENINRVEEPDFRTYPPARRDQSNENINRGYPKRPSRSGKSSVASSRGVSIENINRPAEESEFRTYPGPRPIAPTRSRKGSVVSKKDSQIIEAANPFNEPTAPFRRKKSLRSTKSLNFTEQMKRDGMWSPDDQMVSLQEIRSTYYNQPEEIPVAPPTRRSRTSLVSRSTIQTINDDDRTSRGADSLSEDRLIDNHVPQPFTRKSVTPPGYAKVEKYKEVSPRVPPPRTKRKKGPKDTQFFTVPRRLRDDNSENGMPPRPLRNYSTLRRESNKSDKENIIQDEGYIEIEDDMNKKLQSGEVIQMMRGRPLPAPPRPPRKDKVLKEQNQQEDENEMSLLKMEDKNDLNKISNESIVKGTLLIGSHGNIMTEERVITPVMVVNEEVMHRNLMNLRERTPEILINDEIIENVEKLEEEVLEVETSTQTDPLPDDFCCEEVVAEPTDIILIPTNRKTITEQISFESQISCDTPMSNPDDPLEQYLNEKAAKRGILEQQSHERLSESPVEHYDETAYLKESMIRLARSEQSSLISRPVAEDETTKQPPPIQIQPVVALPETLKVDRLQVGDLDVSRLTVSELMAQKILVSEIDGMSLKLHDISSETGSLATEEIKLPPNFIEEICNRLQSRSISVEPSSERHIVHYREESTNTDDSLTPRPSSSLSSAPTPDQLSHAMPYPHIYVLPPSFYQPQPSTSVGLPSSENLPSSVIPSLSTPLTPDPEIPLMTSDEQSIPNISAQLLRACHSSASRTLRQVLLELSSRLNTGDEKQDANTAIIILVVLVAALMLLGYTTTRGQSVHHHHWEYFNPPSGDKPI